MPLQGVMHLLGVLVAAAVACFATGALAQSPRANAFGIRWQEKGLLDHPLVGRMWSAKDGAFADPASLDAVLPSTDFLLLGEVHDNADAHTLQGWLIRRRVQNGQKVGIVSEHINTDKVSALESLDAFSREARRTATAHDLFRFLDWKTSGWPPQDKFLGLYNAAFHPRLPLYAANPPRTQVRAVARGDTAALATEERARILLDTPMEDPLAAALAGEFKGAHCGMMPGSAIPAMTVAQRYRDAAFADVMLAAAARDGAAILVAGNGHVRTDRAVPWYLRRRAPGRSVVAFMMLEVEDGRTDGAAYVPRDPEGKPAIDYVIFTPGAERPDPCEALRQKTQEKG